MEANFLDYTEIGPRGQKQHFSWITNLAASEITVHDIMRGEGVDGKLRMKPLTRLTPQIITSSTISGMAIKI